MQRPRGAICRCRMSIYWHLPAYLFSPAENMTRLCATSSENGLPQLINFHQARLTEINCPHFGNGKIVYSTRHRNLRDWVTAARDDPCLASSIVATESVMLSMQFPE